uniref:Uncharacterized protein n=1 Tax=Panagrolaimus davidi TaxID=227884 RepID=A0A914PGH7_9BILA
MTTTESYDFWPPFIFNSWPPLISASLGDSENRLLFFREHFAEHLVNEELPTLSFHCLKNEENKWFTCSEKSSSSYNGDLCDDLKEITLNSFPNKIRVTNLLEIDSGNISQLLINEKLESNVGTLKIWDRTISVHQLKLIGSSVKTCELFDVVVKSVDKNDEASLSEIIQCFPLLENFTFSGGSVSVPVSSKTVKELLKIPHFFNIKYFFLQNISDEFDIDEFYHLFLMENKTMDVKLSFDSNISEDFKQKLTTIVNEILESETTDFWPPMFYGKFGEIKNKLSAARVRYCQFKN